MANDESWSLYPHEPNKPAPIIFAILLSVIGVYQIYQSFFRYKWKKFGATMVWATSVWIAGFVCRSISVYNVQDVNIFIAQFVLIIVGPPLYAAAEYFILGRLMAYLPYYAPIHPGRVFSTFVVSQAMRTTCGSVPHVLASASKTCSTGTIDLGNIVLYICLLIVPSLLDSKRHRRIPDSEWSGQQCWLRSNPGTNQGGIGLPKSRFDPAMLR